MSVTPNFSWPLIEPTDFVTNLPADLETLADAIDATVAGLDVITTAGDVIYGDGSGDPERLPIGTAGQVLTVNSGATAPEWADPAGGGKIYTLLNTGGTALTGAATITVSGISNVDDLFVLIINGSSANVSAYLQLRFNTDTGTNYGTGHVNYRFPSTYASTTTGFSSGYTTGTNIELARMSGSAGSVFNGYIYLQAAKSTGIKPFHYAVGGDADGSNGQQHFIGGGFYAGTSAISSISLISSSGNFDNGTVYVYGA